MNKPTSLLLGATLAFGLNACSSDANRAREHDQAMQACVAISDMVKNACKMQNGRSLEEGKTDNLKDCDKVRQRAVLSCQLELTKKGY